MRKIFRLIPASCIMIGQSFVANAQSTTYTFTCPTTTTTWTVPPGVTSITVDVQGAAGGIAGPTSTLGPIYPTGQNPGKGGRVQGTIAVVPGQVLNLYIGGVGGTGTITGVTGGFNGGGRTYGRPGAYAQYSGGGGGGASDIRIGGVALANRVVVAAGGGGCGYDGACTPGNQDGGDGGGATGSSVVTCTSTLMGLGITTVTDATGGTPAAGGGGGYICCTTPVASAGGAGTLGAGGNTGTGDPGIAGGGGGGYWGGGAGCWMGGAGGSSYANTAVVAGVVNTAGYNSGCGVITICATNPGIITGSNSLCPGTTATLSETAAGGTWSSSNTAVATVNSSGVIGGVAAGTSVIMYGITTACGLATASFTVTVNPLPSPIAGSLIMCVGSTNTLSSTPIGGTWTSGNTSVAVVGAATGAATGITTGTSTIVYTSLAGCSTSAVLSVRDITGPHAVCVDSSVTLSVPGIGGLTWTSSAAVIASAGSSSGVVTGVSLGTATITYSGTNCLLTHTVWVGAHAPIAGRDSVCVGGTGYLTNIVGGGTWFSSNLAVASISFDSGLVYGFAAALDTIVYRFPAGCMVSRQITVIGPPPLSTGTPLAACAEGGTTTLANATGGGVWSSSNPSIATVNASSGLVTGVAPDTVAILYTIQPGCSSRTVVTIDPLPERITGRDTVCPGIVDTVQDASPAGSWINGTPSLITSIDTFGITKFVAGHTGGNAIITYKLPVTGCQRTKTVYVYPGPNPTVTYAFWLNTFYTPTGWAGYQWYDSTQMLIPNATSPSLAATHTDYYWVVVTDSLGCKGASGLSQFNIRELNVSNVAGNQVKIYPNPTTGAIRIESPERVKAVISDMAGRVTMEQENATEMDLGRLANGVYMITLYDASGQRVSVQKLTKE